MKLLVFFLCLSCIISSTPVFSQTDSTDITLSTALPSLQTELDSILFGGGNFNSYSVAFTISDTANFGELILEFSNSGQMINRVTKSLTELQNESLIDTNWQVTLDLGNFEMGYLYKVSLLIKNYAGISGPAIIKHY